MHTKIHRKIAFFDAEEVELYGDASGLYGDTKF